MKKEQKTAVLSQKKRILVTLSYIGIYAVVVTTMGKFAPIGIIAMRMISTAVSKV